MSQSVVLVIPLWSAWVLLACLIILLLTALAVAVICWRAFR